MNPLNLIPAPYRLIATIGLVVALTISAYVLGRVEGKKLTTAAFDRAKIEAIQRAITQAQEIAKQDAEIVTSNEKAKVVIRERTREIRIREKNHATEKPLPAGCVLDDERVRNLNSALSGKDADTPKPDYRLPATSKIGK